MCMKCVAGDPNNIFLRPVLLEKCQKAQIPRIPPFLC